MDIQNLLLKISLGDEIQEKLALRYDTSLQGHKESKIISGVLANLFPAFFIMLGWYRQSMTLWWSALPMILGTAWAIVIIIGHRRLPFDYSMLAIPERSSQLLYDSVWTRLWQTGVGVIMSLGFMGGMLVIGLITVNMQIAWGLFIVWAFATMFSLLRYKWIGALSVTELRKKPWLRIFMRIFFASMALFAMLPGIGSMVRVQLGQERTAAIMAIVLLFGLTIVAIASLIGGIISGQIALAQYRSALNASERGFKEIRQRHLIK